MLHPQNPKDSEKVKDIMLGIRPGELGGYFGIKLGKEGLDTASNDIAAGIAALISEIYRGDEQLRVLYNHTLGQPVDPIEFSRGSNPRTSNSKSERNCWSTSWLKTP
jgi:hypothetical protein